MDPTPANKEHTTTWKVNRKTGQLEPIQQPVESAPGPVTRGIAAVATGIMTPTPKSLNALEETDRLLGDKVHRDKDPGWDTYSQYYWLEKEDRDRWLANEFGEENVAKDAHGKPIVRQFNPDTEEMEWMPLASDERGAAFKSTRWAKGALMFAAGVAGALAPPAKAAKPAVKAADEFLGQHSPLLVRILKGHWAGERSLSGGGKDFALRSFTSSAAANVAGGAFELAQQQRAFDEMNFSKVALNSAVNVPVDMVTGYGLAGAFKITSKVLTPFSRGPVQYDYMDSEKWANKFLRDHGYPEYQFRGTPSEYTGSRLAMRIERFSEQMHGSEIPFRKLDAQKDQALMVMEMIMRDIADGTRKHGHINIPMSFSAAEEVGGEIADVLGASMRPFLANVTAMRRMAANALETEATLAASSLAGGVPPAPSITRGGQLIRDSLKGSHQAFDKASEARYSPIFDQPWATDKNAVPMGSLAGRLRPIKKELQTVRVTREEPTGLLDAYGAPTTRPVTKDVALEDWIPDGIMTRINNVLDNADGTTSLEGLKQMRTELDKAIHWSHINTTPAEAHLKAMRGALTEEIESNLNRLGGPEYVKRWHQANEWHTAQVKRFERKGINELFREPQHAGWVGDDSVVRRAISDPDVYQAYSEFFGPNSEQLNMLRATVANDILQQSRSTSMGDVVDAGKFLSALEELNKNNRQLAQGVFGEDVGVLGRMAEAVRQSWDNPNVNLLEFADLMQDGRMTMNAVRGLVESQKRLQAEASNKVKNGLAQGTVPDMKPHQIVDTLMRDQSLSLSEVNSVMETIRQKSPELYLRTQRLALFKIFSESRRPAVAADNAKLLRGDITELDLKSLREQMGIVPTGVGEGAKASSDRVRAMIGDEAFAMLEHFTKLLAPREMRRELNPIGGAMAAGGTSGQLTRAPMKEKFWEAVNIGAAWVQASIYTTPAVRHILANNVFDPAVKARVTNLLIGSSSFINATIEEFGPEVAAEIIADAKRGIDNTVRYYAPFVADALESGYVEGQTIADEAFIPQPPLTNTQRPPRVEDGKIIW
jgi:hypothetical protein